ncbi:MAG: hypothetical protein V2I33_20220 [Kangiellaceae bacterium]|jgi:hypothetical protein|nr:hypothetical protein [Kangiellaceae bacterium]
MSCALIAVPWQTALKMSAVMKKSKVAAFDTDDNKTDKEEER